MALAQVEVCKELPRPSWTFHSFRLAISSSLTFPGFDSFPRSTAMMHTHTLLANTLTHSPRERDRPPGDSMLCLRHSLISEVEVVELRWQNLSCLRFRRRHLSRLSHLCSDLFSQVTHTQVRPCGNCHFIRADCSIVIDVLFWLSFSAMSQRTEFHTGHNRRCMYMISPENR